MNPYVKLKYDIPLHGCDTCKFCRLNGDLNDTDWQNATKLCDYWDNQHCVAVMKNHVTCIRYRRVSYLDIMKRMIIGGYVKIRQGYKG